ncbi:uncharacterized protein TNCV_259111 [Trichonephila clavipes]|uniref:Transposase n=1 Tax=Trichonephila clavipes TaxID=2585209 RepID=A0A8X6RW44_TRICX|nr:uncharacterized protein TNCV_259111 [Trichonephila clavipes]
MQDGAPPHITRCVKDVLKHHFTEERVISRQFRHLWPPRSPDLNPCDFWLWGHLKQLCQKKKVIKNNIEYRLIITPGHILRHQNGRATIPWGERDAMLHLRPPSSLKKTELRYRTISGCDKKHNIETKLLNRSNTINYNSSTLKFNSLVAGLMRMGPEFKRKMQYSIAVFPL